MSMNLLHELLIERAEQSPDHIALIADEQRWSYADLARRSQAMAERLRASGLKKGDRVLILLDNGLAHAVSVWGALQAGCVVVPVHATTKLERLQFLVSDAQPRCLLISKQALLLVQASLIDRSDISVMVVDEIIDSWHDSVVDEGRHKRPSTMPSVDGVQAHDLAALIYTSGSTGEPKGVMLTHANMRAASRSIQSYLLLNEDDRILCALPMCFSYGIYHYFLAAAVGATLYVERAFSFPVKMVDLMVRERITVLPGVPTIFSMLLSLNMTREADWSHLRILTNAGSALPSEHVQQVCEIWPQVQFFSMYGLTECARASYLAPDQLLAHPASVGQGMPGQMHWLFDEDGIQVEVGSVGELAVQGEHVMQGYWRQPESSADRLKPWGPGGTLVLRTGDLFKSDPAGFLYFVGRRDDIIKSRGEKVSPREVEETLHRLPGVRQAAVIGVDDPLLGQAVHAYLVCEPETAMTEREVIRYCLAHLESFKAPQSVHFVEALPHTESGKVLKRQLAQS